MMGGYAYITLLDGKTLKCYSENYEEYDHYIYVRIDDEAKQIPWHQVKEVVVK